MIRCARCHRPVLHPVHIAGMTLGRTCAAAVTGHVARSHRKSDAGEMYVDPRQADMFKGATA